MLNIIPTRQSTSHCGPACLKMVFDYYGKNIGLERISKISRTSLRHGTPKDNMVVAAKYFGFDAEYTEEISINELHKFVVEKKIPVIVNWFNYADKHYSVVVGIDNRFVYFIDPEEGYPKKIRVSLFKKLWFDFSGDYLKSKKNLRLRPAIIIKNKKL